MAVSLTAFKRRQELLGVFSLSERQFQTLDKRLLALVGTETSKIIKKPGYSKFLIRSCPYLPYQRQ